MIKTMQEKLLFLYKFSQKPGQIGSVTPSSVFLAQKMLEYVPWHEVRQLAELGAGTGAITKYLVSRVPADVKVLLFEKDPYLLSNLKHQFPSCSCYADACSLQSALQKEGLEQLDCILSGLPFFNFTQKLRDQLLEQITSSLRPGGRFIAFQYSQQMRQQLSEQLEIEQVHFVPWNIPPAFIYVCRKKG